MADDDKTLRDNMRPKKKKYPSKYTKGSSNVKRHKQLMDKIAHFYKTKKQPYSEAEKKQLDKMMKEKDKL